MERYRENYLRESRGVGGVSEEERIVKASTRVSSSKKKKRLTGEKEVGFFGAN